MRDPVFATVDEFDLGYLRDPYPALVTLLREIAQRQHALRSAWGGPRTVYACEIKATGPTSVTFTVPVPPGVTELGFAVRVAGQGTLTITTSLDATGTAFTVGSNTGSALVDAELGLWLPEAIALLPTSAGASSGRAVKVASILTWDWFDVDLTLAITNVTGSFTMLELETIPLHVAR